MYYSIRVYDLSPPPPPRGAKSLTLEMIDNDGYGGNLSREGHHTEDEYTIRRKTDEYNHLTGESNNPEKLVRDYRMRRLGPLKTNQLALYNAAAKLLRRSAEGFLKKSNAILNP